MLDLHCHLLPSLDDGSVDMEMSLEMARVLEKAGFSKVACSPHMGEGPGGDVLPADARKARDALQECLDKAHISIQLLPNGEHHLTQRMLNNLRQRTGIVPIGGESSWVLVELPWHSIPDPGHVLFQVQLLGYQVLLAHPERYGYVSTDMVLNWAESGIKMQLELGSFVGMYGDRASSRVHTLMKSGAAHVLATDLHRPKGALEWIQKALNVVEKNYGQKALSRGLCEHPQALIDGVASDDVETMV